MTKGADVLAQKREGHPGRCPGAWRRAATAREQVLDETVADVDDGAGCDTTAS
jgi:hypothetical protein